MKYLVNTLFVALFVITVGCSNELTGFDADINPISSAETELIEQGSLTDNGDAFFSTDGSTLNANKASTGNGYVEDDKDQDDTIPPPAP
ncbi:MAG: hypothetical protein ACPGJS_05065 [Flammeovirgaceae bacterium]